MGIMDRRDLYNNQRCEDLQMAGGNQNKKQIDGKQESIIATIRRQDNQDRNKKQSKEKETEKINKEFKRQNTKNVKGNKIIK